LVLPFSDLFLGNEKNASLFVFNSCQAFDSGGFERRILEINRKRVKVVKPGSKTSFPATEMRGSYAPPFHVSFCLSAL